MIYAMVGGDFALGNAIKGLRRMYLDSKEWSIAKYNRERRKLAELQELRRKDKELR